MYKKGFSLVELSIVLIIIGLLIAATSLGTKLIDNSRLLNISKEITSYEVAMREFYMAYSYLPGDLPNAEDLFGASNTNNGDGDGNIYWHANGGLPNHGYLVWQHLYYAGLIKDKLTLGLHNGLCFPNQNAPSPQLRNGKMGYSFSDGWLWLGAKATISGDQDGCWGPGIYPKEAFYIDKKIDDGIANSGNLIGSNGNTGSGAWNGSCLDSSVYKYNVDLTTTDCIIRWEIDFK